MSGQASRALSDASISTFASRLERLRGQFSGHQIDALLVNEPHDIRYLTGFIGDDSLLLVGPGESSIISDPRYDEFLDPWRHAGHVQVVMGVRHRLAQAVGEICQAGSLTRLGIQAEHLTVAARARIADAVSSVRLSDTTGLVSRLRQRKDESEVRLIRKAIGIQQDALVAALARLELSMTEQQFNAILDYEMKMRGAFGASFDAIVGTGPNSSIIHHMTGTTPVEPGVLLVDWGATVDGYCSDLTRTFGIGHMPEKIRQIYPIVLEAQCAAIDAAAPGKTCAQIDAVARDVITRAGYGDHFGHGLGHGLGMDVHEDPYFNELETEVVLAPGMVMTVEPGIYLPGVGGVRIEDDILITDSGAEVLSDAPKDLESMTIEPAAGVAATAGGHTG